MAGKAEIEALCLNLLNTKSTDVWKFGRRLKVKTRRCLVTFINLVMTEDCLSDMRSEFVYSDGSVETSKEELLEMDTFLQEITAEAGEIHNVNGHRCLCINPWASYGGGARALWAVEGHSAQLTLSGSGYVKGKCMEISEDPAGITFQPSEDSFWYSDEPDSLGVRTNNQDTRFLKLEDIRRYDYGWW